jgi:hypothetical protein|tara:strand:+ start:193 stop:402 length:210 start_codon:yes stop_codon:yes gene_type:complete
VKDKPVPADLVKIGEEVGLITKVEVIKWGGLVATITMSDRITRQNLALYKFDEKLGMWRKNEKMHKMRN